MAVDVLRCNYDSRMMAMRWWWHSVDMHICVFGGVWDTTPLFRSSLIFFYSDELHFHAGIYSNSVTWLGC